MLLLTAPQQPVNNSIKLSGSKSIHNRVLILNEVLALNLSLQNSSTSEDTELLKSALQEIKNKTSATIDIHHAGTDMRFLTAYLSTKSGEWILTGSDRMKERPIGELVTALKTLGADITYLAKENFPPLKINGKKLIGGNIEIDGSVSSQFISALLLIAPSFENGLNLTLKNDIVSRPYINMTVDLLKGFGLDIEFSKNKIDVLSRNQHSTVNIQHSTFFIESDWSSASYWFSLVALSKNAEIKLAGLNNKSTQADSVLPNLYKQFGVTVQFNNNVLVLTKNEDVISYFEYDFTNCPDIAQTIAVTCFGLEINAKLTGLKTLKLKESDRIVALKTELEKFGAIVEITDNSIFIHAKRNQIVEKNPAINTYNDHRMAMSFAPLALLYKQIGIKNPEVVSKSYPLFWEDLKSVGFSVNLQP